MGFGEKVKRWRTIVEEELSRSKVPLPSDLILAVIHVESRGYPGSTNEKSGASGLMQVMPKTLEWYNRQTGDNISLSKLRGDYPREQIRVGIWVLAQFWRGAYRYLSSRLTDVPTDELAKIADLFYVAGPGAVKRRLDKLDIPFFRYVESRFPKWNALPHPRNVWKALPSAVPWRVDEIARWLKTSERRMRLVRENAIWLMVAVLVAYWLFLRKK